MVGKGPIRSLVLAVAACVLCSTALAQQEREQDQQQQLTLDDGEQISEDDDDARAIYIAGRVAYDEGRYEDALTRFEEAYDRSGRPALLYNIGVSADRMRRDEEAIRAFELYLAQVPDAANRASVENRLRALRAIRAEREANVATPEEAAATVEPIAASHSVATEPRDEGDEGSLLTSWWLWTIVGVVVLGGVAAAVAVAASSGDSRQEPIPGDYGIVVSALGAR